MSSMLKNFPNKNRVLDDFEFHAWMTKQGASRNGSFVYPSVTSGKMIEVYVISKETASPALFSDLVYIGVITTDPKHPLASPVRGRSRSLFLEIPRYSIEST